MDLRLSEQRFLVAASSKGLGFGIARILGREGAHVGLGARDTLTLNQAAAELRMISAGTIAAHSFDASDAASITAWVEASVAELGGLDGLVVNAGGPPPGRFDDFDDEAWFEGFELTLMSAVRMIRTVLPILRANGRGTILTITSTAIKEPIDQLLLSNVFRSGVVSLVKSLSRELASDGIRINNLVPGRFDTERVRALDENAARQAGISRREQASKMAGDIPLGRYGTADEFGRAAAFLLSNAASYITGTTLVADGGLTHSLW